MRNDALLHNELSAALEFGYLMHFSRSSDDLQARTYYTSRGGFYIANDDVPASLAIISNFYQQVTRPWFVDQSERLNRGRGIHWSHIYDPIRRGQIVTATLPVDSRNYWYGVLVMDFLLSALNRYLATVNDEEEGNVYLYDSCLQPIAASGKMRPVAEMFNNVELAQLAKDFEGDTEGGLRLDSRYVNWVRLTNFDGVLIRVHTLEEGVHGKFGNITIALMLFWSLFSTMLLGS